MYRIVELGSLWRGRVFTFGGRKYKVSRNLGFAGVAVIPQVTVKVRIGGREFERKETREQVWSAGTVVEVRPSRRAVEVEPEMGK